VNHQTTLGRLRAGERARILQVEAPDEAMTRAFLEMGILEGSVIRVMHEAPLGRDPIAVQVRGALIALRRQEADFVRVESLRGDEE